MFLTKASVVLLVAFLGTSLLPAGSGEPQQQVAYAQQPLAAYAQQPLAAYVQQPQVGYQQQPQVAYAQQPLATYAQQPSATYAQQPQVVYQPPQPQVVYQQSPPAYAPAPNYGPTPTKPPILRVWDGIHDWSQSLVQSGLGQLPVG